MKILVLNYEFPPVGGGGGRASADLSQALAARGHDIQVLTTWVPGLEKSESFEGFEIRRVRSGRRSPFRASFLSMAGYLVSALIPGLRIIREWKPDIIHAHFAVPTGALAYALFKLTRTPYILTAHLGDVPGGVPEKTEQWFRFFFPMTSMIWTTSRAVIAVSEYTRDLALQHYPVEISVIPNGVDLNSVDPGSIEVNHPPRILFAGRFMVQKDPVGIVRTLAGIRKLQWECMMLGDGPLRGEIEGAITEVGLSDRIHLKGWVKPEEVLEWMRKSDLLFMPSRSEGLSVVGVQALAMGLAIVAGRVGGFTDLVAEGENGWLYTPEDYPGMQIGLATLLGNPDRLLSARRRSRELASKFDIGTIAKDYEDVFVAASIT